MLVQLTRFAITGFINTVIDFGVFNLLLMVTGARSPLQIAVINLLSLVPAMTTSFIMNQRWTFACLERGRLTRFVIASLSGIAINSGAIIILTAWGSNAHLQSAVFFNGAKIAAALLSATWNFMAYRNWVFRAEVGQPDFPEHPRQAGLVSIIIPAYNEARRLPSRLLQLSRLQSALPVEIIVVNDGSRDDTDVVIHNFADRFPFIKPIRHPVNQGKGAAVKTGMYKARGEHLIFADADDTFTPDHIAMVVQQLQNGQDIVVACRHSQGRGRIEGESRWRSWQGKIFNRLVRLSLLPGIRDSQCGLKGFSRRAAAQIFPRQHIRRFAFDVELLVLARHLRLSVSEIDIDGIECQGSTVSHLSAPLSMALDLLKIKLAVAFNRYSLPGHASLMPQLGLATGLFFLALLIRLPWLWEFPRYIDELKEVNLAYQIFLGQSLPLHNVAHDIGSLHNFILAGIFKLLGVSIYWPRLYVALTSALTVVLIYYIGKELYGKWVGLAAALLLTGNGMHILVTHMAWSNCTTPFFFCLALLALITAEKRGSSPWLILSAFLWALTLQTHSSAIIYVIAVVFYLSRPQFRRQTGIKGRSFAGAGLVFMAGYLNMIYYNFISRGGSLHWLQFKSYALEQHPSLASYWTNLQAMLIELLRSLSSVYQEQNGWLQYLANPWFSLALLLFMAGIYFTYKEKKWLPLYFLAAAMLIMPWINQRYVFYLATRYIMPLILCALLIAALGLIRVVDYLYAWLGRKRLAHVPAFGLLAVLLILQLLPFYDYCRKNSDTNQSNRLVMQIFKKTVNISQRHSSLVILDENLSLENNPLPYLFTLIQQPYRVDNPALLTMSGSLNTDHRTADASDGDNLVAIVSAESFNRLRNQLSPREVGAYSCEMTLSPSAKGQRKVYVIDLGRQPALVPNGPTQLMK